MIIPNRSTRRHHIFDDPKLDSNEAIDDARET